MPALAGGMVRSWSSARKSGLVCVSGFVIVATLALIAGL